MPSPSTKGTTPSTTDLAAQLEASDSATIYTDIPALDAYAAEDMLLADPPLHVEWDDVRGQWAVRTATPDEAADALAASQPAPVAAPTAGSSTSTKAADKD